jgi:hypothetical protein
MCSSVRIDLRVASDPNYSELAHVGPAIVACFDAGPSSRVGPAVARGCEEGTLKLRNTIMNGLLLAPLALAGCPAGDDTGLEGTETGEPSTTTTTTGDDTTGTTAVAESSTGPGEESTGDPPLECPARPPIPEAPVDCSMAKGVVTGSVIIDADGMQTPDELEGVVEVTGSIIISETDLTDLNFMACVRVVGGEITIFNNDALTNVDGLWSMEEIGTDFIFSGNDAITDFNGLPNVAKLINNLQIRENNAMTAVTGFHSLVGIDGSGLDPMGNQIGGNITIQENAVLEHIDGLIGVLVANGVVAISNNPRLCISSIICVIEGILQPAEPPASWTTTGNDGTC